MKSINIEFSLAVITFQSERTVLDTLRSLESLEGLHSVELILADDGSKDQTVALVQSWLSKNAGRFAAVQTLFSDVNRGVAATHTAAFAHASGVWGLYLGGDDFIENPRFFVQLSEALAAIPGRIFRTRVLEYYRAEDRRVDFYDSYDFVLSLSSKRQFRFLASSGTPFRSGPGSIFHVETLRALDGFGTYNRMYEDWSLFLRFTRAGFQIRFLDVPGVLWQRHAGSISSGSYAKMKSWDRVVKRIEVTPYLDRLSLFERWKSRHRGRVSRRLNEWYRHFLRYWGSFVRPRLPRDIVVVRLDGQLGNQLFQYATALAVARRTGARVFYHWLGQRRPEILNHVNVPSAAKDWVAAFLGAKAAGGKFFRWLHRSMPSRYRLIWMEPEQAYWPRLERSRAPAYLIGYWQSYRYLAELSLADLARLASQLQAGLEDDSCLEALGSKVVVHVRRGDAVQAYGELPVAYYRQAMAQFPNTRFLFVSDDPGYCRLTFGSDPAVEVAPEGRPAAFDLRLMIRARGVIVANSTFSWWGAYLNQTLGKKVVAPRQWFSRGPGKLPAASDLFPPEWIVL